ncbi:Uncharacterised protein [Shewanella putrefaciens]|nr:hypothetical protein [Shewanella putrefaciens]SUI80967.1 Uncharacterised protein [Shewanella putrefaciens]
MAFLPAIMPALYFQPLGIQGVKTWQKHSKRRFDF